MSLSAGRAGVRHDQVDTFGRVTSPSFLNELLDCLPEWTDMPVYKGGTEEILPSNTAVPTTSPIVADIKYPDGMRQNQVFTYRETPAEVDGLAKIKSIKGNTLVWNQQLLAPTTSGGTTASADGSFRSNRCAFTYDSDTHIVTVTSLENTGTSGFIFGTVNGAPLVIGHKYLQMCDVQAPKVFNFVIGTTSNPDTKSNLSANTYHHVSTIKEFRSNSNEFRFNFNSNNAWTGTETVYIKNAMLFDLTQMGLDISNPSDFTSLFPLSYYSYNQGSLLSFNGNGIKTVGKNLLPTDLRMTNILGLNNDKSIYQFNTSSAPYTWSYANSAFRVTLPSGQYKVGFIAKQKSTITSAGLILTDSDNNFLVTRGGSLNNFERGEFSFSLTKTTDLGLCVKVYDGVWWLYIIEAENEMATYEPYTESTLSLPISTYFPNGMKSAGSVYDELTPRKAEIRVGTVDLGTLNWNMISVSQGTMFRCGLIDMALQTSALANALCVLYPTVAQGDRTEKTLSCAINSRNIDIIDSTYTSADAFKSAMSGVYLNYELATPVELPTIEL